MNSIFARHFWLLQTQQQEWLFASEKVNTVLAVLLAIFLLVALYLVLTNRKLSALEQQFSELEDKEL
ncbi:MAG: CcmD family protein [Bacteroidota bacterium]